MNLTLLVSSCDSYSPLWNNFFSLVDKYWVANCDKLFVTETNAPECEGFDIHLAGKKPWGERILEALDIMDTDYVFFILEDYYLHYKYSEERLFVSMLMMDQLGIDRLQLSPSGHQSYMDKNRFGIAKFAKDSNYKISMQPSIWRKDFLKEVVKPHYSPWDFEVVGSFLLLNKDVPIYIDHSFDNVYFNAVRKGMRKVDGVDKFLEKEGLPKLEI